MRIEGVDKEAAYRKVAGKAVEALSLVSLLRVGERLDRRKMVVASGGVTRGSDIFVRVACGADLCEAVSAVQVEGPLWGERALREAEECLRANEAEDWGSVRGKGLRGWKGVRGVDDESLPVGIFNV